MSKRDTTNWTLRSNFRFDDLDLARMEELRRALGEPMITKTDLIRALLHNPGAIRAALQRADLTKAKKLQPDP